MEEQRIAKIITVLVLLTLSLYILWPYMSSILFAAILAYLFYPLYERLRKRTSKNIAAASIVVTAIVFLSITVTRGLFILFRELRRLYTMVPELGLGIEGLEAFEIAGIEIIRELTEFVFSRLIEYLTQLGFQIPGLVISGLIFFASFFYFLKEGENIYYYLKDRIPFQKEQRERIMIKIKKNIDAFIYVEIVLGIVQGVLGGVIFYLLGHPYPLVLGIVIGILGLVPVIGPSIIYWPIGIYGILTQNYLLGIGSIVAGISVISSLDYFLRPRLTGKRASIHPFVVLLGFMGGIYAFGPAGIVVGPVLLSVSIIVIDELKQESLERSEAEEE